MTTTTLAGHDVEVDGEGFLQQPDQWTRDMAEEMADVAGIAFAREEGGA